MIHAGMNTNPTGLSGIGRRFRQSPKVPEDLEQARIPSWVGSFGELVSWVGPADVNHISGTAFIQKDHRRRAADGRRRNPERTSITAFPVRHDHKGTSPHAHFLRPREFGFAVLRGPHRMGAGVMACQSVHISITRFELAVQEAEGLDNNRCRKMRNWCGVRHLKSFVAFGV